MSINKRDIAERVTRKIVSDVIRSKCVCVWRNAETCKQCAREKEEGKHDEKEENDEMGSN